LLFLRYLSTEAENDRMGIFQNSVVRYMQPPEHFENTTATVEEQMDLYAEQVKQLYNNALVGLIATAINSLVLAVIERDVTSRTALVVWVGLLVVISLVRYNDIRTFGRRLPEASEAKLWGKRFIVGLGLSGMAWGSSAFFLFPIESLAHQTFLAFVIGGMVAGAAAAFSSIMKAFLVFSVPALSPIIVRFALLGDEFHLAMGGMVLLYGVMMFFIAKQINIVRITSVKLRFENSGLVSYLTAEKEKSDTLNRELLLEIRERARIEEELRKSEGHLRYLSAELINAHEKERKLVAQEIHDSIGGSLASAKARVDNTISQVRQTNPETTTTLESISRILQAAIDEARRVQVALRPSMLDDLGILATINWFCREFESAYFEIHIQKEIDIKEEEVPDSLKIVIYRVLQEAMNNIGKHSRANTVGLSLRKSGGSIELAIRDNGRGFDPAKVHSHTGTARGLGLESMRERVEISGGEFRIDSIIGQGTTIRAIWGIS
jgi:signal transduction histidine kinase